MPSIIQGFQYDIFVSYRHNDNRSGWVTGFVKALQEELGATIKNPVSVYFDANPHDGLLETHNVDKTLEGKLKCLIFIPIISQTYCDTESFAWQHEFCAFNKNAKQDQFGRDITLSSGNVASRILPIKIHELDADDKSLIENELSGVLRAIEFIYKESGVNRPLKPDDQKTENQNKTDYRNQLNKVANAIKELIAALKSTTGRETQLIANHSLPTARVKTSRSVIAVASILLLAVIGYFIYFTNKTNSETNDLDKSIAVLPFKNLDDNAKNQYFADGVMDEIINHLAKIKAIRVVPRTSVEQYRNNRKPANEISNELGVSYLLDGTAQQFAERIKISVQLIDAEGDRQLWSETFERRNADIFSIQAEVAEKIAGKLKAQITPEEKGLINSIPTSSPKAYDYYLRGKEYNSLYLHSNDKKDFTNAITLQRQAISLDSNFANAYANIGLTFSWAELHYSNPIKVDFLALGSNRYGDSVYHYASKALALNPNLPEAFSLMGWYYGMGNHFDEANRNFEKAIELGQLQENKGLGLFHMVRGNYEEAYKSWAKAYSLNGTHLLPIDYTDAGLLYMHVGDLERAEFYQLESMRLQPDFNWGFRNIIYLLCIQGRFEEAHAYSTQLLSFSNFFEDYLNMAHVLGLLRKFDEAEDYLRKGLDKMNEELGDNQREGAYIFWMTNHKDEARERFRKRIEFCEQAILNKTPYAYKRAAYELASIHSFLGNQEQAYRWLKEYAAMGFREGLENYIQVDPLFEPLRKQSEFKSIVNNARSEKAAFLKSFRRLEQDSSLVRREQTEAKN